VSSGDDDHASDADFVGSDSDFEEDEEEADSGDSEEYTRRRKGSSGPVSFLVKYPDGFITWRVNFTGSKIKQGSASSL